MEFTEDFTHRHEVCFQCNGFYGPCFGQPVCATCHAFLYPDDVSKQPSVGPYQEKTDDGDSGNEEPREPSDYYQMQQQQEQDNMQQQLQQPSQQQLQQQQLLLPQMQPQEGLIGNNYSTAGEDASDVDTMEPGGGGGAEGCVEQVLGVIGGAPTFLCLFHYLHHSRYSSFLFHIPECLHLLQYNTQKETRFSSSPPSPPSITHSVTSHQSV